MKCLYLAFLNYEHCLLLVCVQLHIGASAATLTDSQDEVDEGEVGGEGGYGGEGEEGEGEGAEASGPDPANSSKMVSCSLKPSYSLLVIATVVFFCCPDFVRFTITSK